MMFKSLIAFDPWSFFVVAQLIVGQLASGHICFGQSSDANLQLKTRIDAFCSDCHAMPKPESFEKDVWHEEVRKGFEFYAKSGRSDLDPPHIEEVVRYFRKLAPAAIQFELAAAVDTNWGKKFTTDRVDWNDSDGVAAGISSLTWMKPSQRDGLRLLVSDCRDGSLSLLTPDPKGDSKRELLFRAQNPARINPCDLNADDLTDYMVADLGSVFPYDHQLGKVACLVSDRKTKALRPVLVEGQLGRVADAVVGDLRGSSMPDVVVAEFGHRDTGGLILLTNIAETGGALKFQRSVLDNRPGTVRVLLHDFDRDGKNDIVAMVTQESECIDVYLNKGDSFLRKTIWSAEDLAFGCVAMEVVDLDGDHDADVLFCNGDSFDNNFANASHGVQWLENLGNMRFEYHRLMNLTGAYCAKTGDIDGDEDLDIVAVANLPVLVKPVDLRTLILPSVVLLLREGKSYRSVVLSTEPARHSTLEVGDFNQDSKTDFVVGRFSHEENLPRLTFWWQN